MFFGASDQIETKAYFSVNDPPNKSNLGSWHVVQEQIKITRVSKTHKWRGLWINSVPYFDELSRPVLKSFFENKNKSEKTLLVAGKRAGLGSWPAGMVTNIHPLFGPYVVVESEWVDYGSGSYGDHNLHLVNLDQPAVLEGIHQGGTHTLNADFRYWPKEKFLVFQKFDVYEDAQFPMFLAGNSSKFRKFVEEKKTLAMHKIKGGVYCGRAPVHFLPGGVKFEAFQSRWSSYEYRPKECPAISRKEKEGGANDRAMKIWEEFVPWTKVPGANFNRLGSQPWVRYPLSIRLPNSHYSLEARNGLDIRPDYLRIENFPSGKKRILRYFFDELSGAHNDFFWSIAGKRFFYANKTDFQNKRLHLLPIKNVEYVQAVGKKNFLIVTADAMYRFDPYSKKLIGFIVHKKPPIPSWESFKTDFLILASPELDKACLSKFIGREKTRYGWPPKPRHGKLSIFSIGTEFLERDDTLWILENLWTCGFKTFHWNPKLAAYEKPWEQIETWFETAPGRQFENMIWSWKILVTKLNASLKRKWFAAWRLAPGDYLVSEQLYTFSSGEVSKFSRLKLTPDPFGTEKSLFSLSPLPRKWVPPDF